MAFKKYKAPKDPDSTVDYGRMWGDNLDTGEKGWLGENEEIISSVWLISSSREEIPTLVEASQGNGISVDKKSTAIWLEGGTAGFSYNLTNRIETNLTRKEDATGIVVVEEK